VINGDKNSVQMIWSVTGETTQIELSDSKSGKITGLKPKDVYTATVSGPMVYILTAYNGSASSSQMVEIEAVEPTPKPTLAPATAVPTTAPTNTPVPDAPTATPTQELPTATATQPAPTPIPPQILSFQATGAPGNESLVVLVRSEFRADGPALVYRVEPGAEVLLSWQTSNSQTISLNGSAQASAGSMVLLASEPGTFHLEVIGPGGQVGASVMLLFDVPEIYYVFLPTIIKN
jgi:hypothetical protein